MKHEGSSRRKHEYGRFDEAAREYVIATPLTPRPWVNYLSTRRMGALVSQGAGGVVWHVNPENRRISRYDFMGLPEDRPGFYVYIREADGTVWNPSFQPCQTPLDNWECRHGMGYTRFLARRQGLEAELTFLVPVNGDAMLWDLTVRNNRKKAETLFIANYLEFSLFEYYKEVLGWIVLRNQIQFRFDPAVQAIKYHYFVHQAANTNPVFLSGSGKPVGFDCDRAAFIGRGRDTSNPLAVERGRLGRTELPNGGLGIGSLGYRVTLKPGAARRIVWTVGAADTWEEADRVALHYKDFAAVDAAREGLRTFWDGFLGSFQTDLGDAPIRNMINTWNPYGTYATFYRDRDISTELPGLSSGIRFRDAMQNCMSACHLYPPEAQARIELILRHQKADGSAPNSFMPDAPVQPHQGELRCDNPVWSPMTVYGYVAETGDLGFLDRRLPYLNGGEGTVYEHLMGGLRQIARDSGAHGLPLLKGRDWDDHVCLFAEEGAESVMTAQNWCYAARLMRELAAKCGRQKDVDWIDARLAAYTEALNAHAWDGAWYRQILYKGKRIPLGSKARRENKIYINTQAWAVISGTATGKRGIACMDRMRALLDSDVGIKFLVPPYTGIPEPEDRLISNGPGLGENGGVFIQANCWAIMAECMLGRGDRAWEYYRKLSPPVISRHVGPDRYLNEPYMYSSHIVADPDPRRGMANLSWLTGTVNWMYIVATQHILGVRPTPAGLRVAPCLPRAIEHVKVHRRFRGATYDIAIEHCGGARREVIFNGARLKGDLLPLLPAGERAEVLVKCC
ncbi:MAG: hypothetical protein PHR35_19965 [Kiritimatiellae bacterium]|nr:hypothetical protein [Kiritimatiellia bacterium]